MQNKLPTFKEWTLLHESFLGGITPLGVSQANVVGGIVSNGNLSSLEESLDDLDLDSLTMLEEACKKAKAKKAKKKMFGDELGEKKPDGEEEVEIDKKPDGEEEVDVEKKPDHDEPDGDEDGEGEPDGDDDDVKVIKKDKDAPEEKPETEIMLAKKKAKKKMTKEDVEWWNSVRGSASLKNDDEGNWDGVNEPQAGEVGFAPQTRLGWFN